MTDIIETAEEDIAEVFQYQPKPNGLIDRHRKERARRAEAEQEQQNIDSRIEQPSYKAVKTAQQMPEVLVGQTVTIAPGGAAPILPLSKYRYRATIMVSTAAGVVVLAKDQGSAQNANGFTLPYAIPFILNTRAQVWAFNSTASIVQVSVMAEIYAPEQLA